MKNTQELINSFIAYSNAKSEEYATKQEQADIIEAAAKKHDIDAKTLKAAADTFYKKLNDPDKYLKEREKIETKYDLVDSVE